MRIYYIIRMRIYYTYYNENITYSLYVIKMRIYYTYYNKNVL